MVYLINILIRKPVPLSHIDMKPLEKPLENSIKQSQESEKRKTLPYHQAESISQKRGLRNSLKESGIPFR